MNIQTKKKHFETSSFRGIFDSFPVQKSLFILSFQPKIIQLKSNNCLNPTFFVDIVNRYLVLKQFVN